MDEDPFKRSTPRKWRKLVGGGATAVVLLVGVVFLALSDGPKSFEPAGIVDALSNTSWALPREASGLRRYGTQLGPEVGVSSVAVGVDGRLAVALRGDAARIVVWHAGQWRLHSIPETRTVTALAIDPEGHVHVGMRDGRLARIAPDGTVYADPAMVAGRNSVVGFAFDPQSPKSAIMVAGGELHTALRPFEPNRLNVVTMPPARIRIAAYDAGGTLIVAGDGGTSYASTASGWDDRPLANAGQATAFGRDGHGKLLLALDNGYVFRQDGRRWQLVGQVGSAPVAVGELESGVVVIGGDGAVWSQNDEGMGRNPPLVEGTVTAGVVAGVNLVAIADAQLIVRDPSATWSTHQIAGPARGCSPVSFDAPPIEPLVRCGTELHTVTAEGVEPREVPSEWNLDLVEAITERNAAGIRMYRWLEDSLLVVESLEMLRRLHATPGSRWDDLATVEEPTGPIHGLDALGDVVWLTTRSGSLLRGDLSVEPFALTEATAHESFVEVHAMERVDDISVVAHQAGALVMHATNTGPKGTFVSPEGLRIVPMPPEVVFFHVGDRVLALSPVAVHQLTPTGLVDAGVTGLDERLSLVSRRTVVRVRGDAFAFRVGDALAQCKGNACRVVDTGILHSFSPTHDGDVVIVDGEGLLAFLPWQEP